MRTSPAPIDYAGLLLPPDAVAPQAAQPPLRRFNRTALVGLAVLLLHAGGLWTLQAGLLRKSPDIVMPARIVTELVTPLRPRIEPAAPAPRQEPRPEPVRKPPPKRVERPRAPAPAPAPRPAPAPEPLAVPGTPPAPNAPTGSLAPQPAPPPVAAPVTIERARPAALPPPPPPAKVELPSSAASYLQNPLPVYPALSKRLGEQGQVLARVLIGADGLPKQAEVKRSSSFDRLDRAALDYVMKCRYVPGTVGGVPQAMWYEAPVSFVLE